MIGEDFTSNIPILLNVTCTSAGKKSSVVELETECLPLVQRAAQTAWIGTGHVNPVLEKNSRKSHATFFGDLIIAGCPL